MEGRKLSYSVRLIQDVMAFTKQNNTSGLLLQIDFEKAFDSVEWNFLFHTLKLFNFGESLINWIKVIYTNISSCVINNGNTSPYFKLTRSLRQGDPLSGYLFILVLELLAQKIRESQGIRGIFIGKTEIKLTQYVDDLTVFVADVASAREVFAIFDKFYKAAGLKVNKAKCEGLWIESSRLSVDKPFDIKWPIEPLKVLGVYLSYNSIMADHANFDNKIEKLKRQLHWWKARDLTILGRILIVKSLGISKFAHLASMINIPDNIVKSINTLIFQFVWQGKTDRIKRDLIIQDYDKGGLKMVEMEMVIKASKIMWIKEYLDPSIHAKWKANFEVLSNKESLAIFLQSNFMSKELPKKNYPNIIKNLVNTGER